MSDDKQTGSRGRCAQPVCRWRWLRNYRMDTKLLAVLALLLAGPAARAQFINNFQTNNISGVTSNWMGNGTYVVGSNTFFDTLIIQNGGVLSNGTGYIGYEAGGSNNTAIVSGSTSTWSNNLNLYIG